MGKVIVADSNGSADEEISLVDEDDNPLGIVSRKHVHKKGLLHRESYVYLISPNNQVLLQKRADTKKWDHSAAGHFSPDETYLQGAQKEFEEELGVKIHLEEFKFLGKEK